MAAPAEDEDDSGEDDASSASTISTPKKAGGGGGGSSLCLCLCVVGVLGVCGAAAAVAFILLGDAGAKNSTDNATEGAASTAAASAASGGASLPMPGGAPPANPAANQTNKDEPKLDAYGRFATDDDADTTQENPNVLKEAVGSRQRLNRKTARVRAAKRLPNDWARLSHHSKTRAGQADSKQAAGNKQRGKVSKRAANHRAGSATKRLRSRTTRQGRVPVAAKQHARNVSSVNKTLSHASLSVNITNETVLRDYDDNQSPGLGLVLAKPPSNLTTDTTDPKKVAREKSVASKQPEEQGSTKVTNVPANFTVEEVGGSTNSSATRLPSHGGGDGTGTGIREPADSANLIVNQTRRVDESMVASNNSDVEQSEKDIVWRFQNEA